MKKNQFTQSSNPEMEAWLEQYGLPVSPQRGTLMRGTVVALDRKLGAFVNYGGKTDAIVPSDELEKFELVVDQSYVFFVTESGEDDETAVFSIRRARGWMDLQTHRDEKTTVTVKVTKVAKNHSGGIAGVNVRHGDLSGFVPFSMIGKRGGREIDALLNTEIAVKVVEVAPENRKLIFDHAQVLVEQQEAVAREREALFSTLKVGETRTGRVARIATKTTPTREVIEYGVFVDIGSGLHGLVHRTEIPGSPARASQALKVGDEVSVKLLKVEKDGDKPQISLSIKQAQQDTFLSSLKLEDVVRGRIARQVAFGFFVELSGDHHVDGLLHKSQLSSALREGRKALAIGDEVQVKIIDLQPGRIGLSMRGVPQDRPATEAETATDSAEETTPVVDPTPNAVS